MSTTDTTTTNDTDRHIERITNAYRQQQWQTQAQEAWTMAIIGATLTPEQLERLPEMASWSFGLWHLVNSETHTLADVLPAMSAEAESGIDHRIRIYTHGDYISVQSAVTHIGADFMSHLQVNLPVDTNIRELETTLRNYFPVVDIRIVEKG